MPSERKPDRSKPDNNPDRPEPAFPFGPRLGWLQWLLPVLLVAGLWVFSTTSKSESAGSSIEYTTFYAALEQGKVASVVLQGSAVRGRFSDPQALEGRNLTEFRTRLPAQDDPALLPLLRKQKVSVVVEEPDGSGWVSVVAALLPWLLILGAWVWLSRRTQRMLGGGSGLAGLVKPATRRVSPVDVADVGFDDVAGLKSAKRDLQEIVAFLRNAAPFERLGGKLPRGVLLVGAPGTGKTLLARAVAGEAGVPFFSISGSEFIELFVGVGAARVRDLFQQAKTAAPAIVFIDEIDAVGRSRGTGLGGGHDEREQTLNQLLAEMDGFARSDQVVVLAATNRPDVLDPALMRPGRFDRRVVVDLPETEARVSILEVHTRDKPLGADVSLQDLAAATPGFSGADLANLCNEAALNAVRRGADKIERIDFFAAHDKVLLGDPRETRLSVEEKRRVAVHETGHAVAAFLADGSEPLRRVTILPRGLALGATQQTPLRDKHLHTKSELLGKLRVLLGGYAAEKLLCGEPSSGAEDDLRKASELAEKMVSQLGMSEALGPAYHEHHREHPFLGARIATDGGVSDATLRLIEQESQRLLDEALGAVTELLVSRRALVDRMIAALLERETLEADDLQQVLRHATEDTAEKEPDSARRARVVRLHTG